MCTAWCDLYKTTQDRASVEYCIMHKGLWVMSIQLVFSQVELKLMMLLSHKPNCKAMHMTKVPHAWK